VRAQRGEHVEAQVRLAEGDAPSVRRSTADCTAASGPGGDTGASDESTGSMPPRQNAPAGL
jgi:hypothetical protein